MRDTEPGEARPVALSRERVTASALQQSARHERATQACLAELAGVGDVSDPIAGVIQRRALRHARRAVELAATAVRLNRDPLAAPLLAGILERHERGLRRVAEWTPAERTGGLSRVG